MEKRPMQVDLYSASVDSYSVFLIIGQQDTQTDKSICISSLTLPKAFIFYFQRLCYGLERGILHSQCTFFALWL